MTTLIVVFVAVFLAIVALVELGYRKGKRDAVQELRIELARTSDEWHRRADDGDLARALELPGISAVRVMLGDRAIEDHRRALRLEK